MTRDDIYDHLARVYLGKRSRREEQKTKKLNAWLVLNIIITMIIFASSMWGLTAFLKRRDNLFKDKIIFALHKGPVRVPYDLVYPYPPVKTFLLPVPQVDVAKYKELHFSIRGLDEGYPGIMRVEVTTRKNETSSVFIDQVHREWKEVVIPLEDFDGIADWHDLDTIAFVLEAWNAQKKKGIILIDDICFSG